MEYQVENGTRGKIFTCGEFSTLKVINSVIVLRKGNTDGDFSSVFYIKRFSLKLGLEPIV